MGVAVSVQHASAQPDTSGQKPGKIAVVNRKTVFDNYNTRATEWKALEESKNALQAELDKLRESINAAKKRLREETAMPEAQSEELKDKITADERAYEDKWRRAQGDIDDKANKFFARILGQIDTGVREVGAAENYKIIFEADPKAGTPVLYFDSSLDITEKVTGHLNRK